MRGILLIGAGVAALVAATFLPQVQDYRAEKADAAIAQGDWKAAKQLSFLGKLQGDQKAANNYHVLNYKLMREDKKTTRKRYRAVQKKTFRGFDELTQEGFVPAAYNAGMFYYRSSSDTSNFQKGLAYLDYAAKNGDEMARDAAGLMRAQQFKDEAQKAQAMRKAADSGNGLAAYRYANSLRFKPKQLARAEKYALMGAEAGYADAQAFLGIYFPRRTDAEDWLKKAATNPENRNMRAPLELAEIAKKRRKSKERRDWLTLGVTPRAPFRYKTIRSPDGLRWRGLQSSIDSGVNNDKYAAYLLAKMQMDGIGGPLDKAAAIKNLEYSDGWGDADLLLARLRAKGSFQNEKERAKALAALADEGLKKFDAQKNYPFHSKLRPLIKNKHIRYATQADLKKFANGVSKSYSHEKLGYTDRGSVKKCAIGRTCFYLNAPIVLPNDMFGSHSATFIVSPTVFLPEQHLSHNRYIFISERNVPK